MRAPHFGFVARWYDLWVGAYWSRPDSTLYLLPLPCLGFSVTFGERAMAARLRAVVEAMRDGVEGAGPTVQAPEVQEIVERAMRRRGFMPVSTEVGRSLADSFMIRAKLAGWGDRADIEVEVPVPRAEQ